MTTKFLGENSGVDGVVEDEEEFVNAAATVFVGKSFLSSYRTGIVLCC